MAVKRVKNHGAWMWRARVGYRGKQRARFCESKAAAEQAAAELRQELKREAEQEQREPEQPVTLTLVAEAYLLDLEARGKSRDTLSTARNTVERLKEYFGTRMQEPLRLTEGDLYDFRAYRLSLWAKKGKEGKPLADLHGVKASTINRDLRTMRAMLRHVFPDFKFPGKVFLPEDETRVRWLEPKQEAEVLLGMRAPFRQMAQLAALTLMRLSEIRSLRREYVHLGQGIITLPHTKTGPGVVMLNAEAQRILKTQLRSHDSEWAFPNPETGSPYSRHYVAKVWRVKARKAGLSDFHFHDLRHHGATLALNAGFSGSIVMDLGRWKSERMMRRYAAVTNQTLRAAAEAIGRKEKWSGQVEQAGNSR
jgi:integrase